MRHFAKISVEKHTARSYGHVMHCRGRGLCEIDPLAFQRLLVFDGMSQSERLSVINAGMMAMFPVAPQEDDHA